MHKFLGVGMAALLGASAAGASTLVSVVAHDSIYGSFTGSIPDGAVGAAAILTWNAAGHDLDADIGLTDASGTILFDLFTDLDTYTLLAAGSGDPQIGTSCAGNLSACVVVPLHVPTSLAPTIASLNGGLGICCGGSGDLVVTYGGTIPEPASWTLLIAGFVLTGTALRARAPAMRAG